MPELSRGLLLRPAEVAEIFRVDPKTVTRWAVAGKIESVRSPGGHRRFPANAVVELLEVRGTTHDEAIDIVRRVVH